MVTRLKGSLGRSQQEEEEKAGDERQTEEIQRDRDLETPGKQQGLEGKKADLEKQSRDPEEEQGGGDTEGRTDSQETERKHRDRRTYQGAQALALHRPGPEPTLRLAGCVTWGTCLNLPGEFLHL